MPLIELYMYQQCLLLTSVGSSRIILTRKKILQWNCCSTKQVYQLLLLHGFSVQYHLCRQSPQQNSHPTSMYNILVQLLVSSPPPGRPSIAQICCYSSLAARDGGAVHGEEELLKQLEPNLPRQLWSILYVRSRWRRRLRTCGGDQWTDAMITNHSLAWLVVE